MKNKLMRGRKANGEILPKPMKMMSAKMPFGKMTICAASCHSYPNDVATNVIVCKDKYFDKLAATCDVGTVATPAVGAVVDVAAVLLFPLLYLLRLLLLLLMLMLRLLFAARCYCLSIK